MTNKKRLPRMLFVCLILSSGHAAGQDAGRADYTVKPSDVIVPEGVPMGQYRRMTRPFTNWTLICDEDLKKKKRVCNVSQTIVDAAGAITFSWSLAATNTGSPIMILRTPPAVGKDSPVQLSFADGGAPLIAMTTGCDTRVCLAVLPVGLRMKQNIGKGLVTEISYVVPVEVASGTSNNNNSPRQTTVSLHAPLEGLSAALAAI